MGNDKNALSSISKFKSINKSSSDHNDPALHKHFRYVI